MKSYETSLDHNHILDYCELLHLLLQFKKTLISIIEDKNIVQKIIKCQTPEELINLLDNAFSDNSFR